MRTPLYPRLAYLAHQCPGRIRFRLRWLRDDPATAARIAEAVAALDGVADVEVKAFTGSVRVRFDPERTSGERVTRALLRATGLPRLTRAGAETDDELELIFHSAGSAGSELARALVGAIRSLDGDLLRRSAGEVSLGTLVSLGFLGTAAARLARTGRLDLPEWYQLVWWSFRTFTTAEADLIAGIEEIEETKGKQA